MSKHTIPIVYLGIDVHKRTYAVTAIQDKVIIKHATMPAIPEALLAFINRWFGNYDVQSAYEAGFSGFGLHRFLIKNNIKNIVVHAASIEVVANNRSKTDKRDSKKIASQLAEGKLQSVNIPSLQREAWRSITRVRLQLVTHRSRLACQIKSLLHYFGLLPHNHTKRTCQKWLTELMNELEHSIDKDVFFTLKILIQHWLYFNDSIKVLKKRIRLQAKEDSEIGNIYLEMAGIGLLSARTLANELGDFSQFHSQSGLFSFIGLTPKEYSSGDHTRRGNISRMGNPIIRKILTEAAWKAIGQDSDLNSVFDRIQKNTGSKKKAIVAIARKMIGRIRGKFKKKEYTCVR